MSQVSVVLPVRNRAEALELAAISVLTQPETAELLVVDDASEDGSVEVAARLSRLDSRVRLLRLPQQRGAAFARNHGVGAASQDLVAFQDSDDVWLPGKLAAQVRHLAGHPEVDLVACQVVRLSATGAELIPRRLSGATRLRVRDLLMRNVVTTQSILVRRAIARAIPFDTSLPRYQDWDFVFRVVQEGAVDLLPFVGVVAVVQSDSVTADAHAGVIGRMTLLEKHKACYGRAPFALCVNAVKAAAMTLAVGSPKHRLAMERLGRELGPAGAPAVVMMEVGRIPGVARAVGSVVHSRGFGRRRSAATAPSERMEPPSRIRPPGIATLMTDAIQSVGTER